MNHLLSKRQVAEVLGIHPESVMRLAREGRFPAPIKLGTGIQAAVRFDEEDVQAWLAERKAARANPDEAAAEAVS